MAPIRSGKVRDHELRAVNRPAGAHDQGGPHSQPVTQSTVPVDNLIVSQS